MVCLGCGRHCDGWNQREVMHTSKRKSEIEKEKPPMRKVILFLHRGEPAERPCCPCRLEWQSAPAWVQTAARWSISQGTRRVASPCSGPRYSSRPCARPATGSSCDRDD